MEVADYASRSKRIWRIRLRFASIVYVVTAAALMFLDSFASLRTQFPLLGRLGTYSRMSVFVIGCGVALLYGCRVPTFLLSLMLLSAGAWVMISKFMGQISTVAGIIAIIAACLFLLRTVCAVKKSSR